MAGTAGPDLTEADAEVDGIMAEAVALGRRIARLPEHRRKPILHRALDDLAWEVVASCLPRPAEGAT